MTTKDYARQIKADVEAVFATESGKRVMELLEQIGHYNIPTWSKDSNEFLLNEGKRQVVLTLKTIIKWPVDKIEEEIVKQLQ
jgi:hypothetical protein